MYKDIWATVVGEELPCQRKDGNRADPFAVAVVRGEAIFGHVPKKISLSVCSLYLCWDGSIVCRVTGSRCFSGDLVQGHLFYSQSPTYERNKIPQAVVRDHCRGSLCGRRVPTYQLEVNFDCLAYAIALNVQTMKT